MTTVKVTDPKGKEHELQVFSKEELKSFLSDESGPGRKASMKYLNALGRTLNEVVKMETDERVQFVLERYAELGVEGGGGKAKAKAATASKPAGATVTKLKAVSPPKKDEEEEDAEEEKTAPAAKAAPAVGGVDANKLVPLLSELVAEMRDSFEGLQRRLSTLEEHNETLIDQNTRLSAKLDQQEKTLLDAHFLIRVIARAGYEWDTDDIAPFADELYDTLVVEPSAEAAAGEEEEEAAGNG